MSNDETIKRINKIKRLAGLIERQNRISAQAKELREKIAKECGSNNGGYYSTVDCGLNGAITLAIAELEYRALFPDAKPMLATFGHDGATTGRLKYPRVLVGEAASGASLFVEAWSPRFELTITAEQGPVADAASA